MRFHFARTDGQPLRTKTCGLESAHYADHLETEPRASASGDALCEQGQHVLCVVSPRENAYSQTFVRAHIENLPARVKALYGADYKSFYDDNGPLVRPALYGRLTRAILRRSLRLRANYYEERALKRFLLDNGVDAVLAEFGPSATSVMNVCTDIGIPLIAHFHGFDAYRRATLESFGLLYGELFRKAAAIIAVSRDMQRQLSKLGAPKEKLHYNSCGVDVSMFHGADPLHSTPTFIAVGRFVDKKAPHLTLLAFKKVIDVFPSARLIMIGDGPLWEACYQLTSALRLSGAVELPGPCSHSEIVMAMKRARAFVQHSIRTQDGDSEGTPVAVLEAGASGLPVVATRHAGIQDAVIDGETGLLVEEGDIDGMAERMLRLAEDAALAARLGESARRKICSEYSMTKSINTLWHIIEASIHKRSGH